mmetsp:Transcript_32049/g.92035  ORF Transcript_32049/g.92035 Transcript_32049/m.92035 type:complete len:253 (+) Transcript_32049:1208-1966(+)
MVDHRIRVHSNTQRAASVDHLPEIIARAHAPLQAVRDRLVHEVPRIQDVVERLGGHDLLHGRKHLHSQIAHGGQVLALPLDVRMRPAKQLHDRALLATTVVTSAGLHRGRVPTEVQRLQVHNGAVRPSHRHWQRPLDLGGECGLARGLLLAAQHVCQRHRWIAMLGDDLHGGTCESRVRVNHVRVSDQPPVVLERWQVASLALQWCVPAAGLEALVRVDLAACTLVRTEDVAPWQGPRCRRGRRRGCSMAGA